MKFRRQIQKISARLAAPSRPTPATTQDPAVSAQEVVSEYKDYIKNVRNLLTRNGILAAGGLVLAYIFVWISSAAPEAETKVKILLSPLPASIGVACFSILAALSVALQIAVRGPSGSPTNVAHEIARKRFLVSLASVIALATLTLSLHLCIPSILTTHREVDLVRILGPLLIGLAIAMVSADAAVAADPRFGPEEQRTAWNRDMHDDLAEGLRVVTHRTTRPARAAGVRQVLVLLGTPAILAIINAITDDHTDVSQGIVLTALVLLVAIGIYLFSVKCLQYAVTREWISLIPLLFISVLLAVLVALGFSLTLINVVEREESLGRAAWIALWGIAHVALPTGLAYFSLRARGLDAPRGLLRQLVARRITQKLTRLPANSSAAAPTRKTNKLAITAAWVSVFVPFGLILAIVARAQIARSNAETHTVDQRSLRWSKAAISITVVVSLVLSVGLIVLGVWNPRVG